MEIGFSQNVGNGLRVCLDWLSFTLTQTNNVDSVLSFLGMPRGEFQTMPRGLNGYQKQLKHTSGIIVLYGGNEDMGVHVIVSGSAIHALLEYYYTSHLLATPFLGKAMDVSDFDTTVLRELLREIVKCGNVTRLDLAMDDIGTKYYNIHSVIDQLTSGCYSSKFKGYQLLHQRKGGHDSCTVYLGSRQSSCMLRIYDKQAEQNAKLARYGEPSIETPWLRWELELKHSNAHNSAVSLSNGKPVAELAVGLLSNYLRFVNLDNSNISRCTTTDTWLSFCHGISKFSVYVPTPPKTIDDVKRWLNHQVAPSLAKVVMNDLGDMDAIYGMIHSGAYRLSAHDENYLNFLERS